MRRSFIRTTAFVALAGLAVVAVGCGDDDDDDDDTTPTSAATTPAGSPTGAADAPEVAISDNAFSPSTLTITAGDTVTWNWSGSNPHSVVGTFEGEDVESDEQTGTGSFEYTFEEAGEFEYECGVHGSDMSGTITVEAS